MLSGSTERHWSVLVETIRRRRRGVPRPPTRGGDATSAAAARLRAWAHDPGLTHWALAFGLLLGFGLGWLALALGPWAAAGLALLLAGGLWLARRRVDWVSATWPVPTPLPPPPPSVAIDPDPLITMVPLPGGRFSMGSGPSDGHAYQDERPRHPVRLSPFHIARTPVTRGLWRRVMQHAPESWWRAVPDAWRDGDDDLPATHVSWEEAAAFCNALSALSGRHQCYAEAGGTWTCDWGADGYRLPTEAEWEYACRGGRQTPWHWGRWPFVARRYAWYAANAGGRLHPVGGKRPNRFGLYDMAGNCWEWSWDWYDAYSDEAAANPRGPDDGRARVLRGGSFALVPRNLRSADRLRREPWDRGDRIGFRCVRSGAPAP